MAETHDAGAWNASLYDARHAFVHELAADLIEWLAPAPRMLVVDLGCGTGHLTALIAERGATCIGIDRSAEMIEQAQRNFPQLDFRVGDAAGFTLDAPVDAVFSNAALHWVLDADGAARSIAAALKPQGRFVAEFGGHGNVAQIIEALEACVPADEHGPWRNPWFFPSIGQYATLLERHGLETRRAAIFDRATRLDDGARGLRNWLDMFARGSLSGLAEASIQHCWGQVERRLESALFREGAWHADYRRLRVEAIKIA